MKSYIIILMLLPLIGYGQFNADHIDDPFANTVNGKQYLQPLNEVYSSLIHSGVFPRLSEEGFHIKLGLHITRINFTDAIRSYSGTTEGLINNVSADAPTIVGENVPISISEENNSYVFPAGVGVENLTLAAPEFYVGTLLGTDFYGRWIRFSQEGDLGDVEFYGGGIRHDFGRYFLPEYMKWHLAYSYHIFELGEHIQSSNQYLLTQLGFQLNRIGLYGLFGYEMDKMNISFTNTDPDLEDVNVELTDLNPYRYGGGVNLSFKFFEIYGEYNMNDPVNIVFGVSLGI